jgi:hypothetical protein
LSKIGILNLQGCKGISTSELWRTGYNAVGSKNYSSVALNILSMLNLFTQNKSIKNINSHFGVLQFDEITRDIIYPTFLIQKYKDSVFINKNLLVTDPFLGTFKAVFINNNPITSNNIFKLNYSGKAVALLELTNGPSDIDLTFYDSIYYFWYNDTSLPRFPIIDTTASIAKTIELLDEYYNNGYRIFLGFSRSTVVRGVLAWFKAHPDATGISIVSRASTLAVPKNIYRLEYPQNVVIITLLPVFEQAPTLYYIYTDGETVALDYLNILSNDPNINLKTLVIKRDSSNLTLEVLSNFLTGSVNQDIILLVLFFNQQQYFDLYNEGLYFGGQQYYIIGALPTITGEAQNILDKKLINIQSIFPNTSLLFRNNAEYLTNKFKKISQSYGLINALMMIKYIQEKKSISLLGSHLGVLQFDKNNDLKYESFLTRVYDKEINNFVKFQLQFNDPLLGKFVADFV